MKIKIRKLYKGYASIRSSTWNSFVQKREDLIIEYKGKTMTIPHNRKNIFQIHHRKFLSKFDGRPYELIDFKWVENSKQKEMLV